MAAYDRSVRYEWPDSLRDNWDPEATVNVVTEQLQHSPIPGAVTIYGPVYRCVLNATFDS